MTWGLIPARKSQQSSQLLPRQPCLAGALSTEGPWFTSAQFSWDCSALRMLPCDCLTVSCLFYICLRLVRSVLEPGAAASRATLHRALFYFCNTRFLSLPGLVLRSWGFGEVGGGVSSASYCPLSVGRASARAGAGRFSRTRVRGAACGTWVLWGRDPACRPAHQPGGGAPPLEPPPPSARSPGHPPGELDPSLGAVPISWLPPSPSVSITIASRLREQTPARCARQPAQRAGRAPALGWLVGRQVCSGSAPSAELGRWVSRVRSSQGAQAEPPAAERQALNPGHQVSLFRNVINLLPPHTRGGPARKRKHGGAPRLSGALGFSEPPRVPPRHELRSATDRQHQLPPSVSCPEESRHSHKKGG